MLSKKLSSVLKFLGSELLITIFAPFLCISSTNLASSICSSSLNRFSVYAVKFAVSVIGRYGGVEINKKAVQLMLKLHQFLHVFITLHFAKLVHKLRTTHSATGMCSEITVLFTFSELKPVQKYGKPPRNRRFFSRRTAISVTS